MARKGAWAQAEREATLVCQDLADLHVAGAAGRYQLGELHRLRGDLAAADAAYRRAHELDRDPQPGLALLRLAQGRAATASASIRAALTAVTHDRLARAGSAPPRSRSPWPPATTARPVGPATS